MYKFVFDFAKEQGKKNIDIEDALGIFSPATTHPLLCAGKIGFAFLLPASLLSSDTSCFRFDTANVKLLPHTFKFWDGLLLTPP
jgi:hypothetical protein